MKIFSLVFLLGISIPVLGAVIIGNGTSRTIRSWGGGDLAIVNTATSIPITTTPPTVSTSTINYRELATNASAGTVTNYSMQLAATGTYASNVNAIGNGQLWTIATTDGSGFTATIDPNVGYITCPTSLTTSFTTEVTYNLPYPHYSIRFPLVLQYVVQTVTNFYQWNNPTHTTLPGDLNSEVDTLISAISPANTGTTSAPNSALEIYTNWSNSAWASGGHQTNLTRNSSVWTGSTDFSGISCGFLSQGQSSGVLITNQDVICGRHANVYSGQPLTFISPTNVRFTYTASTVVPLTDGSNLCVVHLTTSVDSSLKIYSTLPSTYWYHTFEGAAIEPTLPTSQTSTAFSFNYFPLIYIRNADNTGGIGPVAYVRDANDITQIATSSWILHGIGIVDNDGNTSGGGAGGIGGWDDLFTTVPSSAPINGNVDRRPYTQNLVIGGDSGSPIMSIVNGTPIVIGFLHLTNGAAAWIPNHITGINAALVTIYGGGAPTIGTVSLSGFTP